MLSIDDYGVTNIKMPTRIAQTTITIDKEVKSRLMKLGSRGDYASWDEFMLYVIKLLEQA